MKRIFLFLAATAVLASCVKDNLYDNLDGNVTIKAVASDTKTLLEDTDVHWESNDVIKVVYHTVEQSADFSVKGSVAGSTASFTGTLNPDWTLEEKVHPYAVYPATAVTLEEGTGNTVISHTLPEVQTGTVTSGMNLSSAILSEEDLAAGAAEAVFHNALTLLQVVVPEGVASVELSADYGLVGTATFYVNEKDSEGEDDGFDDNDNTVYENVPATGKLTLKSGGTQKAVTLSGGNGALEAKTHSVLVYPGTNNSNLTLTMTGTDGAVYTNTLNVKLLAGECRLIDLTKIFGVTAKSEYVVFPAGGTVEIPVATASDYTVSLSEGADSWISYSIPSKAFHAETIVFTVAPNEGESREATVTISSNGKTTSFKISQKEIYMDFVYTEENPIKWDETFGLYSDEQLTSSLTTFTNTFTIELSDDFHKGTYKISGMFVLDKYHKNSVLVTNTGGDYYANYNSETGELTVLKTNSASGYVFPGDVVLTYDSANKTFSAATMTVTLMSGSAYYNYGATRYIGNYTAAVKVSSGGLDPLVELVCGTYTEDFTHPNNWPNPGVLTIAPSDNESKGNVMLYFCSSSNAVYGTVSSSSYPTIVVETQSDPLMGPMGGTLYYVADATPVQVYGMSFTIGGATVSYYSASKN